MNVQLVYFKLNGKYYGHGDYESDCEHLFQIWEEVRVKRDARSLPGLVANHSFYYVLIGVPKHPHNHPHLITQ